MSVLPFRPHSVIPTSATHGAHWWAAVVHHFTAAPSIVDSDTGSLLMPRHCPPKNYEYLQDSAMRRAMERL